MKRVLIFLFALGLFGAGIVYYIYNKPVASLEKKKADVVVSAAQLIADYEADEKAADQKYHGKVVEVTGKVLDIMTIEGKITVHLETPNPMSYITFQMETGAETGPLKAGDEATIKGKCTGYLDDVILVQSTVVKQ